MGFLLSELADDIARKTGHGSRGSNHRRVRRDLPWMQFVKVTGALPDRTEAPAALDTISLCGGHMERWARFSATYSTAVALQSMAAPDVVLWSALRQALLGSISACH